LAAWFGSGLSWTGEASMILRKARRALTRTRAHCLATFQTSATRPPIKLLRRRMPLMGAIWSISLLTGGAGARPFTPTDDVGLALFEFAGQGAPGGVIKYSPDGRYLAVVTERGRLSLHAPEDTIWVFRIEDVRRFLRQPDTGRPAGLPLVRLATDENGPIIENVRWLPDSSGIAFTAARKSSCCKFQQLFLADVASHVVKTLTPENDDVGDFDIRNSMSYVYEVSAPTLLAPRKEDEPAAKVLTGQRIWSTIFPSTDQQLAPFSATGLWAVIDGKRRQVLDAQSYSAPPSRFGAKLSLSPDGRSVVTILKTENPPMATWSRYKAPPGYDKSEFKLPLDTSAYHLVDLIHGTKTLLVNAPSGLNQDWHSYLLRASWSVDGRSVLLPDTFFPLDVADSKEIADRERHPYIAVLRMNSGKLTPVLAVRAGLDKKRYAVQDARFEDDRTVVVNFDRSAYLPDYPPTAVLRQQQSGAWHQLADTEDPRLARLPFKLRKWESVDQPPQLVAVDRKSGLVHVLWDPNPQLKDIELGTAMIVKWKDDSGYEWEAGLLLPPGYTPGRRYPLVIQTHGFEEKQFLSSGSFTTAFAARALAAADVAVLQMGWNPNHFDTPKEGPDQVRGFESAVKKLTADGIVDPTRVGVIGFSRSVYHVLFALAAEKSPFAAASVTDGVNYGYLEYIINPDLGRAGPWEADAINGARPFGAGLKSWLARSPEFNMEKVKAPLLLLQPGPEAVLEDWEPYATLSILRKPVDLIMLHPGTHVMTNPDQRLASETANVDWFRFWLQGYQDPDPSKTEQYVRWEKLCDLQRQENPQDPGYCVPSSMHRSPVLTSSPSTATSRKTPISY
jgi:dipeptidyl aminopeptidase/acylaminoacyl peptidase